MMTNPAPIKPRKLSKAVEERLLKMIREEGLAPGDQLPSERELMQLYQVGRPAIREAMQNIERMGLIEIRHGGRPRVAEPSLKLLVEQMSVSMQHLLMHSSSSLDHLKQARVLLEAQMARIAASRRTPSDIKELKEILQRQETAKDDSILFLEIDGQFHRKIAAISGNPVFESVAAAIFDWLREFHVEFVRKPGLEDLTLEEHQAILSAVEDGDPEAAEKAVEEHLTRANKLYHLSNLNAQAI